MAVYRSDRDGSAQQQFKINKKKILATQEVCAICGRPVDKSLRFPDPWSPTVDHIIPVARNGHPFDMSNLQLAHLMCNRAKATKLMADGKGTPSAKQQQVIANRDLPLSLDWKNVKTFLNN